MTSAGSAESATPIESAGSAEPAEAQDTRDLGSGRTPAGRLAGPEEPAHLVAFLCSPEGQWINGQILFSNGGFRTAL